MLKTIIDEAKFHELNAWVKSCRHLPTFARPGRAPRSRTIVATEGCITHRRKRQETDAAYPPYAPLEEATGTQDGYPKRRVKIQDLVRHALILCGAQVPQGRAPRGNVARELSKAFFTRERQGKREGNAPIVSVTDRSGLLTPLAKILLQRWRSRRQSSPEPSRSEIKSEGSAFLLRAMR